MMRYVLILAAALVAASPVNAAPRACTEMACEQGLHVNFNGDPWPAGTYKITIMADDKKIICMTSLPFRNCNGASRCNDPSVQIGESGCALPLDQHTISGFSMPVVPQKLTVHVADRFDNTFTAAATIDRSCTKGPNGPGCEPKQCCGKTIDITPDWK